SVLFNNVRLATTFVSPAMLTAVVPASLIGAEGAATVSVDTYGSAGFAILAAPQPLIGSLSPASATAGGGDFTLTVTGSNFLSWARVRWSGTELSTTFVSGSQLTAAVPARLIANSGAAGVTVTNSIGAISSPANFTILQP